MYYDVECIYEFNPSRNTNTIFSTLRRLYTLYPIQNIFPRRNKFSKYIAEKRFLMSTGSRQVQVWISSRWEVNRLAPAKAVFRPSGLFLQFFFFNDMIFVLFTIICSTPKKIGCTSKLFVRVDLSTSTSCSFLIIFKRDLMNFLMNR